MKPPPTAFLVQRIGPYHHARFEALARALSEPLAVLEFRPEETVYAWERHGVAGQYQSIRCTSAAELTRALAALQPSAIVCTGYSDPEIHRAAAWGLRRGLPLVTCSDSTHDDEPRRWIKEALKRLVLSAFDAALVAGTRADRYLDHLGVPAAVRFRPWDVVDNAHFEEGADAVRRAPEAWRQRLGLPDRYLLCVARFVAKKNLQRLIAAYARYASGAGDAAWSLVLSGSGPLEPELRLQARQAGLNGRVRFTGCLPYGDLPACYGLGQGLILPSVTDQWGLVVNEAMAAGIPTLVSSKCGCAPDLVEEGRTGFTVDPLNVEAMAEGIAALARLPQAARAAMGLRAREVVAAYSPERFASGLRAALASVARRSARPGRSARLGLLNVLSRRRA